MEENIRLSIQGIRTHKLRSFLTMLGVIIGIAAIIAIVSIVEGTNRKLEKELIGSGNNVTVVSLSQDGWEYEMDSGIPEGVGQVSEESVEQIRQLDNVTAASKFHSRSIYEGIFYADRNLTVCTAYGIGEDYPETLSLQLVKGRMLLPEEYESGAKAVMIDEAAASALFGTDDPLGKVLELQQEPFQVVGVVRSAGQEARQEEYETIDDYYNDVYSGSTSLYVPDKVWPVIYQYGEPERVAVQVTEAKHMESAAREAAEILNTNVTSSTVAYASADAGGSAQEVKTLTNAIKMMLVSIASLALLVGGIGVMNIMLVSVSERTSEIGLKKALGAKKKTILGQFLIESAVLTSLGGILGVILGIILAKIITVVADLEFAVSIPSIIISVAFSMGIGVLFGMMPAVKAARLDPIEALRRE